jgi:hypothetical protein
MMGLNCQVLPQRYHSIWRGELGDDFPQVVIEPFGRAKKMGPQRVISSDIDGNHFFGSKS